MAKGRKLSLEIATNPNRPVFLNLAAAIIAEIERGRLKPGDALPGTRALSQTLKVHRNTVDAAFHELTMQGWLVAHPSRGTFVAGDLPTLRAGGKARARTSRPAEIRATAPPSITLTDGAPDPRIMPHAELAREFRRALTMPSFLSGTTYGDPRGSRALRTALADYLTDERGLTASPDDILVARGSQMALFLAAAAVLEPGQVIAVEEPGYPLAWSAFRASGARVVGIPVDASGFDVDRLARLAEREPALRAVYLTPHHQYPTTVTLGAGRRLKLLEIASRHDLTVIEDDYDHEYRFDGRPILPLATRASRDLSIIYVGSLSKVLAPAVRIGYAVAQPGILRRMADRREAIDRQGDIALEQALANLIQDGVMSRHTRKARRVYEGRRDFLVRELSRELGDRLEFSTPPGGLAIWARLQGGLSAETWARTAAAAGLSIIPGIRFALNTTAAHEAFRIGYASLDEDEMRRAVALLARSRSTGRV